MVEPAAPNVTTAPGAAHPDTAPIEAAVAAMGITLDQLLNRAPFLGGTLGDNKFHGGEVLLWRSEAKRFVVRAALDLGEGRWRSSSVTTELVSGDSGQFSASHALLKMAPGWSFTRVSPMAVPVRPK